MNLRFFATYASVLTVTRSAFQAGVGALGGVLDHAMNKEIFPLSYIPENAIEGAIGGPFYAASELLLDFYLRYKPNKKSDKYIFFGLYLTLHYLMSSVTGPLGYAIYDAATETNRSAAQIFSTFSFAGLVSGVPAALLKVLILHYVSQLPGYQDTTVNLPRPEPAARSPEEVLPSLQL